MNILMIVLVVAILLVAAVLIVATRRPDTFRVRRSTTIDAPAGSIFPLISDLRAHESWSPFDKPDEATNKVYSGSRTGQGSVYEWDGKAGTGRIAITESSTPSRIVMQLDMIKPCTGSNVVMFTLQPKGESTEVSWVIEGSMTLLSKVMDVVIGIDRMCGKQFEVGLASLKAIVERSTQVTDERTIADRRPTAVA
jgi:uncharacterized protein YndB with AHSA1/START domain